MVQKSIKKSSGTDQLNINWEKVARLALSSRIIDEIEENELVPSGKINYQFSAKGHELAQILLGLGLDQKHDCATVYYRSRPFMLASGFTAEEAFAANMAKTGSPSEGRDVGVVYSMQAREGATVLPSSGDVGTQYTPAAGWAQSITYYSNELQEKDWEGSIAAALGGDGSVATNGFWSGLTIATTLKLPMLFFIEDNGYGISVPSNFQTPGGNISKNLKSFGNLKIFTGSGTEPIKTAKLIQSAISHVRSGEGPCLLHVTVPRLTGHTYGEDQSAYKSSEKMKAEQKNDPLIKLEDHLKDTLDWITLKNEVEEDIRRQLKNAENIPEPEPTRVINNVFSDTSGAPKNNNAAPESPKRINMSESIRRVMEDEMKTNPKLLIFGEDVGIRGGVHRVTTDLQNKFGESRVFDTSLSEEGIIGRAAGMALAGLRPLPEIQFRKYADPATEQINDIGTIRWRTANKFSAPVVIRIPIGHSKKTGDPWHAASGEAIYAHTLGWRVAIPSNAADAAGLLRSALREDDPSIFLEHRALLDYTEARRPYPGAEYQLPFGKANIVKAGNTLTIVTWGEMVYRAIQASVSFGDEIEIIDLRTIIPWDKETVLKSVVKTGKCMLLHEDTRTGGFAGEIIATIIEEIFTSLDAPIRRVTTPDVPIPYNISLMNEAVIPNVKEIERKIKDLLAW